MILKGKDVSDAIDAEIIAKIPLLYEKGIVPTLAIVRVGEKPGDIAYEKGAIKKAEKLGIRTEKYTCPSDINEEDLVSVIESINKNEEIHGVLLLQPLPERINGERVRNTLVAKKDPDCISNDSLGRFFTEREGSFAPCTAQSCLEILRYYNIPMQGKKAVVIGRSMVIGKPVALMMIKENATVTVCHTKTSKENLINYCKDADIIISAAGHAGTLTAEMVRSGHVIIDVGINFSKEGKMIGDVDYEPVSNIVNSITPVPGGVGSVTTSVLMKHLVEAACL